MILISVQLWPKMAFNFKICREFPTISLDITQLSNTELSTGQCHHLNDLCIRMGSDVSSFNVPFITDKL